MKRKPTPAEAKDLARDLIDRDDPLIYDVAANYGQDVDNIRETRVLRNMVAAWLMGEES